VAEIAVAMGDVEAEAEPVEGQVEAAVTGSLEETQAEPGAPDTEAEEAPGDADEGEHEGDA